MMKTAILGGMMLMQTMTGFSETMKELDGEWRFALDPEGVGESERWYARSLDGSVNLPGGLTEQGIGDPIKMDTPWTGSVFDAAFFKADRFAPYRGEGAIKVPFWLQPDRYYTGKAWYQREIEWTEADVGRIGRLFLERPHWKTSVWVDGVYVGSDTSLSTPHRYDLGLIEEPGRHTVTVCVDNGRVVDIGENSHSISDHTQGNWNGIVGRIELESLPPVWLESTRIDADLGGVVSAEIVVRNPLRLQRHGTITLQLFRRDAGAGEPVGEAVIRNLNTRVDELRVTMAVDIGEAARPWSEFDPSLYEARIGLEAEQDGDTFSDAKSVAFGFRRVEADGNQLLINGRKLFLRGTLECAIFPRTGHPPTDAASWRKVFGAVQEHGLNHVRFHSWCPPEIAFEVADEMGVYLQVEAASWPNQSTTLGDGKPVDDWIEVESKRVLAEYGNHPSFIMMASGNEPGGERHEAWLSAWLERRKAEDGRRLYTSASGWPQLPESDYHVTPDPRIQQWGAGLNSRINKLPPETMTDYRDYIEARDKPVVSHEIGQWCVYPDFEEIAKYTGYLKPKNFEIFRDWLEAKGMGRLAKQFVMASGKLQALCYKEDIESALRTQGMGGFQLLDLHDFPGQGTALVGILDPFWEEKGYISPAEFRRFCDSVVPLARFPRRVFTEGESVTVGLELSHHGADTLQDAKPVWSLIGDDGAAALSGELGERALAPEGLLELGTAKLDLAGLPAPARYRFELRIEGTEIANDWDIWLYPKSGEMKTPRADDGALVVDRLDDAALAELDAGGTVWLQIPPSRVKGDAEGPVQLGFSTTFWNTSWTNGQAPHTMGILCDPEHAALAAFPTDFHSDWQWWYVVTNSAAMILDDLPADLEPVVRVVDDWFHVRRLALAFEGKVGNGRLIVSSVDFSRTDNPVVRQLEASLRRYADSPAPRGLVELEPDRVRALIAQP